MTRPTKYTPAIAAEICCRIADGEPLRRICETTPRFPSRISVYNWIKRYPQFRRTYLIAKQAQADLYLDDVVLIADGKDEGWVGPRTVERDRMRVAARRWLYAVTTGSLGEGDPVEEMPEVDELELAARIAGILDEVRKRQERSGER